MTRENDPDAHRRANTPSQHQGTEGLTQSQRQGPGFEQSQEGSGAAQPPAHPVAPRRGEGPDEQVENETPSGDAQRVDEAARRLKSSSADKERAHGDRGQEGDTTQRYREDRIGTDRDPAPPLQSPQDDLA